MNVDTIPQEERKRRTVYITDRLWERLKLSAKSDKRSLTSQLELILEKQLNLEENDK